MSRYTFTAIKESDKTPIYNVKVEHDPEICRKNGINCCYNKVKQKVITGKINEEISFSREDEEPHYFKAKYKDHQEIITNDYKVSNISNNQNRDRNILFVFKDL